MIFAKKLFLFLCIFLGLQSVCATTAHADDSFGATLNATYDVSTYGNTTVQQHFTLTNKKATVFAKEYSVEIGSPKIQNVRATDDKGKEIPSAVTYSNNKTKIVITFNDQLVGEGKTRSFTIFFDDSDTATINGNVLEVHIPQLTKAQEYDSFQITLKTPEKFGVPVRVTPTEFVTSQKDGMYVLNFAHVGDGSVSALFGKKQIFEYTLHYNLENPTGSTGVIQVALPPDTAYQKVVYSSLEPQPSEMSRDDDGNWIATYKIEAAKNVDVQLRGKTSIYLANENNVPQFAPGNAMVAAQKYWESNDPQIQALAKTLDNPKKIYDYVSTHLTYNYVKTTNEVTRLGALGSLKDPKNAACQEFTDLFIAIARAAHIPARRATGFAYTANQQLRPLGLVKDVLHAWPEYYDASRQTWVPVDPTWGNTTGGVNYFDQFDFNHFVFAINGSSSTLPYGAGLYKSNDQNVKSVDVRFGQESQLPTPNFEVTVSKKSFLNSLLKNVYTVNIKNTAGFALYNVPLQWENSDPELTITHQTAIDYILPFQTKTVSFEVQAPQLFAKKHFNLTLLVQGISSTHELQTGFTTQDAIITPLAAIVVGGCMVIFAAITGSLLVSRRKR